MSLLLTCLPVSGCQHGGWDATTRPFHEAAARHHARRADTLSTLGDDAGAARALEAALDHDPRNAVMHVSAAEIYARRGQFDFAVGHYQAAVRADPSNVAYTLALAEAWGRSAEGSLDQRERLEAAARAFAHAGWLDPTRLDAALGSAWCQRRLGRFGESLRLLREAEKLDPSSAAVCQEIAAVYEEMGELDAAVAEYGRALKLDPDNVTAHNACGSLNLEMSRNPVAHRSLAKERAAAHFRKSLEINPDQPHIRSLLGQLESAFAEAAMTE